MIDEEGAWLISPATRVQLAGAGVGGRLGHFPLRGPTPRATLADRQACGNPPAAKVTCAAPSRNRANPNTAQNSQALLSRLEVATLGGTQGHGDLTAWRGGSPRASLEAPPAAGAMSQPGLRADPLLVLVSCVLLQENGMPRVPETPQHNGEGTSRALLRPPTPASSLASSIEDHAPLPCICLPRVSTPRRKRCRRVMG